MADRPQILQIRKDIRRAQTYRTHRGLYLEFSARGRQLRRPLLFTAFAVDINGTVLARYDLAATEEELAEQEARQYLEQHQVIEVWSNDHRRVARIVRT